MSTDELAKNLNTESVVMYIHAKAMSKVLKYSSILSGHVYSTWWNTPKFSGIWVIWAVMRDDDSLQIPRRNAQRGTLGFPVSVVQFFLVVLW